MKPESSQAPKNEISSKNLEDKNEKSESSSKNEK